MTSFEQSVKAWHESNARAGITRTFELGDLICLGVANLGITERKVIKLMRTWAGSRAMCTSMYDRAARMVRVFTDIQRATLIEAAIPIEYAEILASKKYDGEKRIRAIGNIKSGKMKTWKTIAKDRCSKIERVQHCANRIESGEDLYINTVNLKCKGEWDKDAVVNLLANLMTSCPIFGDALAEAQMRARHAGKMVT